MAKRFDARLLSAFSILWLLVLGPAEARPWKPDGHVLAEDYAVITDMRANHDVVLVFWLAPPMVQNSPAAQALLDKYTIIGVAHGHQDPGGAVSFDTSDGLEVKDTDGTPLALLQGNDVPPVVAGAVLAMGGVMRQSLGALGQGMRFFTFTSGYARACGAKGQLSVVFAGETYTYDTPIPGCPG